MLYYVETIKAYKKWNEEKHAEFRLLKLCKIDEGIYWVGYQDSSLGLHSNPYLIVEGDEAVVIDGGSRPDLVLLC